MSNVFGLHESVYHRPAFALQMYCAAMYCNAERRIKISDRIKGHMVSTAGKVTSAILADRPVIKLQTSRATAVVA